MRAAIPAANSPAIMHLIGDNVMPAEVMCALRTVRALPLADARALANELGKRGLEGTRIRMDAPIPREPQADRQMRTFRRPRLSR
ncbi:hypothetical protein GCM10027167_22640 [Nocardia heshunensis]